MAAADSFALNVVTYLLHAGRWPRACWAPAAGRWWTSILFVCFAVRHALDRARLLECRSSACGCCTAANDALAEVAPYAAAGDEPTPLRIKTAILMTLRNEDPERAILRLQTVKDERRRYRAGRAPSAISSCSDTNDADVAAAEEAAVAAWRAADPDARPHRLPPPHRQHRLQGRQRARLLRPLGPRLRADAAARRRQPDVGRPDRAPGAHDAGAPQDRHPAEPGGRHAVDERVRAHFPVRHAPRHALLHHGPGLVGRRLRTVLGP